MNINLIQVLTPVYILLLNNARGYNEKRKEFAAKEKLEIVASLCEARTAKEPGRTVFGEMLARIEKGEAQGILAWHPHRLARNSIDEGKIIYLLDTGKIKDLKFPTSWFDSSLPTILS